MGKTLNIRKLYSKILSNKLVTICILFTFFTLLDSLIIVFGLYPPKVGIGPYIHLLGRFILHTILISSIYLFDFLRKHIKYRFLIYIIIFLLTWGLLLAYIWGNSFFIELSPNAYLDASRSYAFMYIAMGVIIYISNKTIKGVKRNVKKD